MIKKMGCKHVYYPMTLIGAVKPEFYVCEKCGVKADTEDECWYYDKDTNELRREIKQV